jgi:hypothetical protein
MPNHCQNKLIITGDNKELFSLVNFVKSEDSDFDFNKVLAYDSSNESTEYEWRITYWGTKSNAIQPVLFVEDKKVIVNFDTAWSPSMEIAGYLSQHFPSLLFIHKYEEVGLDFSGYIKFKNGKILEQKSGNRDDFPLEYGED